MQVLDLDVIGDHEYRALRAEVVALRERLQEAETYKAASRRARWDIYIAMRERAAAAEQRVRELVGQEVAARFNLARAEAAEQRVRRADELADAVEKTAHVQPKGSEYCAACAVDWPCPEIRALRAYLEAKP